MPITFQCIEQNCLYEFNVSETHIGRQSNCPKCGKTVIVPSQAVADGQKLFIDTYGDRSATHFHNLMTFAILQHREDVMKWLLDQRQNGRDININAGDNTTNKRGGTFMNFAAACGNIEMMKCLMRYGARVDVPNNDGDMPIHFAAIYCHFAVVEWLVNVHRVNVNVRGRGGRTPIHCAAGSNDTTDSDNAPEWGKIECIRYLKENLRADIYLRDNDGNSAMDIAVWAGYIGVIGCLADMDRNLVEASGDGGQTPIFAAVAAGQIVSIKCLHQLGANVEATDAGGLTPMFHAASMGQTASMKCLKELGANVNRSIAPNGFTPIFFAAATGQIASMECLKELGARLDVRSNQGTTVPDFAVRNGQTEAAEWLRRNGVQ